HRLRHGEPSADQRGGAGRGRRLRAPDLRQGRAAPQPGGLRGAQRGPGTTARGAGEGMTDWQQEVLQTARVARLATVDDHGQPHVIAMGTRRFVVGYSTFPLNVA
ncbi:pyridoxamine 5'-phosphate oxidase family protein, partial [Oscillochloris sp. ZM17-4]|nr:pyridoxamine 5'-phosphate oxidase family protein [Oscillochloris sp. ZM17-4]